MRISLQTTKESFLAVESVFYVVSQRITKGENDGPWEEPYALKILNDWLNPKK